MTIAQFSHALSHRIRALTQPDRRTGPPCPGLAWSCGLLAAALMTPALGLQLRPVQLARDARRPRPRAPGAAEHSQAVRRIIKEQEALLRAASEAQALYVGISRRILDLENRLILLKADQTGEREALLRELAVTREQAGDYLRWVREHRKLAQVQTSSSRAGRSRSESSAGRARPSRGAVRRNAPPAARRLPLAHTEP